MNKFKTSAIEILKKAEKPLHYKEITRLALEAGILETEGATPDNSMNAQIIIDIKQKGKDADFVKVAPSTYGLNPNRKEEVIKNAKIEETEEIEEEKIKIEGGYTGKGGEHLVCSELLFRGFNASIMSVDVGMDIIATKKINFLVFRLKLLTLISSTHTSLMLEKFLLKGTILEIFFTSLCCMEKRKIIF